MTRVERPMCPHGCGYEAAHCGCDLPIPMTRRKLRELLEGREAALLALVDDWHENARRALANAENDRIPALDRRQCFGVSQAYGQCADELASKVRGASQRNVCV